MFEPNAIPDGHTPTALQAHIIELLNKDGIEWVFQDTAGGCNALSVTDPGGLRQVVVTNCEDDGEPIFIIDAVDGLTDDMFEECALFATHNETWGEVVYSSDCAWDFINIARFLTDHDSDPFEHVLPSCGKRVMDVF